MFKIQTQIDEVVVKAKAFMYENTQEIAAMQQKYLDNKIEQQRLSLDTNILNLIRGIEFIGGTLEGRNKLCDALQNIIQPPKLSQSYVEDGYIDTGYVKPNP